MLQNLELYLNYLGLLPFDLITYLNVQNMYFNITKCGKFQRGEYLCKAPYMVADVEWYTFPYRNTFGA